MCSLTDEMQKVELMNLQSAALLFSLVIAQSSVRLDSSTKALLTMRSRYLQKKQTRQVHINANYIDADYSSDGVAFACDGIANISNSLVCTALDACGCSLARLWFLLIRNGFR